MRLAVLVVLLAAVARADIPVPELPSTTCVGKTAGAPCGAGGRCVAHRVRRPDFSVSPPSWSLVEVLLCEGEQVGDERRILERAGLLGVALGGVLLIRRRRQRRRATTPA
jgi:hypothetical protein